MAHKVVFSPLSLQDLDDIWDHIASELASPLAAEDTVKGILDVTSHLAAFPYMGAPLESRWGRGSGYRFVISGNYLAFYRVTRDTVHVDRILYSRRDYMHILFGTDGPND